MKIVVLGTNGFLSRAISNYAKENRWDVEVYGLTAPSNYAYDSFYRVDFMKDDIPCENMLSSDIIVYAVGAGIQSNLKEKNESIYKLNVTVPVSICNRLRQLEYSGRFVSFGSVFEIGESEERRFFSEKDVLTSCCKAPNDYSVSKRMFSSFVSSYSHDFVHWHFILPTIYGNGENPLRLIPYTVDAIRRGTPLHFTSGDQTRQYICVSEIPEIVEMAMSHDLESGIYNVEGKDTKTVREIVDIIHKSFGIVTPDTCFGDVHRADEKMKYLALDGSKLKQSIGFHSKVSIEDVLKYY